MVSFDATLVPTLTGQATEHDLSIGVMNTGVFKTYGNIIEVDDSKVSCAGYVYPRYFIDMKFKNSTTL
jgi:hypothetical protein